LNGTPQDSLHFVAYHNSDEFGPYYENAADRKAREGTFVTAKPFRKATLKGQKLWAFEGSGSPRRYSLITCGTISRLTRWIRPSGYRKPGREYGIRVHFNVEENRDYIDVTDLPWFKTLLRQQQSFRNGLNRITDPKIIRSLEQFILRTGSPGWRAADPANFSRQVDVVSDFERIYKRTKNETTRQALIEARLGQGQFRADVGHRWNGQCAVSGCRLSEVLRASHVKPWSKCTNEERLNPENGLLLAAHIDALFDRGLVSFSDSGTMLVSKRVSERERNRFRLPAKLRRKPTKTEGQFIAYHRRHVFDAP
jgi:HNH endonuclease